MHLSLAGRQNAGPQYIHGMKWWTGLALSWLCARECVGLGRLTSPVIFPLFLRRDRMSSRVDFPAPLGPSSARHSPGKALPRDGNSTCEAARRSACSRRAGKAERCLV